jgi:ATP-dependent DNA ligase
VKPKLVAEINYAHGRKGAVLRKASFEALREYKKGTAGASRAGLTASEKEAVHVHVQRRP